MRYTILDAILPVEEIGETSQKKPEHSLLLWMQLKQLVALEIVDVKNTKCNFMAFNGSKWLMWSYGNWYCFIVDKDSSELLEPMGIGGESAMIYDEMNKLGISKRLPD